MTSDNTASIPMFRRRTLLYRFSLFGSEKQLRHMKTVIAAAQTVKNRLATGCHRQRPDRKYISRNIFLRPFTEPSPQPYDDASGHNKTPSQGRGFEGAVTATAVQLSRLDCTATRGSAVQSYAGFCTVSPELSGSLDAPLWVSDGLSPSG